MTKKSALQRLSYKIAEDVAELIDDSYRLEKEFSTEDIYLAVWLAMPLDEENLAAEQEAFERSMSKVVPKPSGPTLMQRLREAVHADKGAPMKVVLEAAIEKCLANTGDME